MQLIRRECIYKIYIQVHFLHYILNVCQHISHLVLKTCSAISSQDMLILPVNQITESVTYNIVFCANLLNIWPWSPSSAPSACWYTPADMVQQQLHWCYWLTQHLQGHTLPLSNARNLTTIGSNGLCMQTTWKDIRMLSRCTWWLPGCSKTWFLILKNLQKSNCLLLKENLKNAFLVRTAVKFYENVPEV